MLGVKITLHPLAFQRLKDPVTSKKYQIEQANKFQVLEHTVDVEKQWNMFVKAVADVVEVIFHRWSVACSKQWISEESWALINKGKEAKI